MRQRRAGRRLRLSEVGPATFLLLRAEGASAEADAPFTCHAGPPRHERAPLAARYRLRVPDLSVFDDFPAALGHDGGSTGADASQHLDLVSAATILGIAVVYETFLGHARA